MKIRPGKLKILGLSLFMSVALGIASCSTGTSDGATNVEESDAKDKNPNDHNDNGQTGQVAKDSAQMDDAYERTDGDKGVHDRDNDGRADQ